MGESDGEEVLLPSWTLLSGRGRTHDYSGAMDHRSGRRHVSSVVADARLVRVIRRRAFRAAIVLPICSLFPIMVMSLIIAMELYSNSCPESSLTPVDFQFFPRDEFVYLQESTRGTTLRIGRSNISRALDYLRVQGNPSFPFSLKKKKKDQEEEEKEEEEEEEEIEHGRVISGSDSEVIILRDYWPKEVFHPESRAGFSAWTLVDVPDNVARKLIAWNNRNIHILLSHNSKHPRGQHTRGQFKDDRKRMKRHMLGVTARRKHLFHFEFSNSKKDGRPSLDLDKPVFPAFLQTNATHFGQKRKPTTKSIHTVSSHHHHHHHQSNAELMSKEKVEEEGVGTGKHGFQLKEMTGKLMEEGSGLYGITSEEPSPETELTTERLGAQEGLWQMIPSTYVVSITRRFNDSHDKEECFDKYEVQRLSDCRKEKIGTILEGCVVGIAYAIPFVIVSVYMGLLSAVFILWIAAYPFDHHYIWGRKFTVAAMASEIGWLSGAAAGESRRGRSVVVTAAGERPPSSSSSSSSSSSVHAIDLLAPWRGIEFLSKKESKKLFSALQFSLVVAALSNAATLSTGGVPKLLALYESTSVQVYAMEASFESSLLLLAWTVLCVLCVFALSYWSFRTVREHDLQTHSHRQSRGCCCISMGSKRL